MSGTNNGRLIDTDGDQVIIVGDKRLELINIKTQTSIRVLETEDKILSASLKGWLLGICHGRYHTVYKVSGGEFSRIRTDSMTQKFQDCIDIRVVTGDTFVIAFQYALEVLMVESDDGILKAVYEKDTTSDYEIISMDAFGNKVMVATERNIEFFNFVTSGNIPLQNFERIKRTFLHDISKVSTGNEVAAAVKDDLVYFFTWSQDQRVVSRAGSQRVSFENFGIDVSVSENDKLVAVASTEKVYIFDFKASVLEWDKQQIIFDRNYGIVSLSWNSDTEITVGTPGNNRVELIDSISGLITNAPTMSPTSTEPPTFELPQMEPPVIDKYYRVYGKHITGNSNYMLVGDDLGGIWNYKKNENGDPVIVNQVNTSFVFLNQPKTREVFGVIGDDYVLMKKRHMVVSELWLVVSFRIDPRPNSLPKNRLQFEPRHRVSFYRLDNSTDTWELKGSAPNIEAQDMKLNDDFLIIASDNSILTFMTDDYESLWQLDQYINLEELELHSIYLEGKMLIVATTEKLLFYNWGSEKVWEQVNDIPLPEFTNFAYFKSHVAIQCCGNAKVKVYRVEDDRLIGEQELVNTLFREDTYFGVTNDNKSGWGSKLTFTDNRLAVSSRRRSNNYFVIYKFNGGSWVKEKEFFERRRVPELGENTFFYADYIFYTYAPQSGFTTQTDDGVLKNQLLPQLPETQQPTNMPTTTTTNPPTPHPTFFHIQTESLLPFTELEQLVDKTAVSANDLVVVGFPDLEKAVLFKRRFDWVWERVKEFTVDDIGKFGSSIAILDDGKIIISAPETT